MRSIKGTRPMPEPAETPGEPEGITERVLAYFRRNSEAMDSVEGIARFWVREDRSVVERTLAGLHGQGLLDRRVIAGTAFYSLHKEPAGPRSEPAAAATRTARSAPEAPGRLLVIDDDPSVRTFLVEALSEA